MDGNWATGWWIVAGALVAAELLTGTFYLLMLAVGAAGGAVAAHFGATATVQVLSAGVLGGAAIAAWHGRRSLAPRPAPASANPDVNLDIGQTVHVDGWSAEGQARVQYRGTAWQARFVGTSAAAPGRHTIRAIDGNCLLLDR